MSSRQRLDIGVHRSRQESWLLRACAMLFGLSLLLVAEWVCVAFGWGRPSSYDDPFVGFSGVHPLFVLSQDGDRYSIATSRHKFFAPDWFAAKKAPHEFRIFVLGGSTVQGRPYATETSFPTWLELALHEADSRRRWEVVNCGGISYATYRLVPVLQEVLNYEPDLIIFCEGHNEFLEDRTYGHIKHAPAVVARPMEFFARRRLFVLLRGLLYGEAAETQARKERPILADDADAMLNYHNGLAAYHRDDVWQAGVIEHFTFSLRQIVGLCRDARVPLVLVKPPSNLADQPPFKSEHGPNVERNSFRSVPSGDNSDRNEFRSTFRELVSKAQSLYRTDVHRAIESLRAAIAIDDQFAATWYELGKCYETVHEFAAAREAFIKARDLDICPLRMISPLEEAMEEIALNELVPYLDAHKLLEDQTLSGILGNRWLVDRCHPSFEGHQLIANALVEELTRLAMVEPRSDWQERAATAYREHFESLPPIYFARGEETIKAVNFWTQGLADGPAAAERFPGRMQP